MKRKKMLKGVLLLFIVGLLAVCGGDPDEDLGSGNITAFRLTGKTSRPMGNVYMHNAGGDNWFEITVEGINPSIPASFNVIYTIEDYFGKIIKEETLAITTAAVPTVSRRVPIDTSEVGHFTVRARIEKGMNRFTIPVRGTRPTGFLTYAVFPDVAKRRQNATPDEPHHNDTIKPFVDQSIYFGMFIIPNGGAIKYDGDFDLIEWMGIEATGAGELAWRFFWNDDDGLTDLQRLDHFLQYGTEYVDYWDPGQRWPTGASLYSKMFGYQEILAYMPTKGARTPAGEEGLYGGELSPNGEIEFAKYCEGIAKICIAKGAQRPRHYFQVLWEPDDWWGGWLPTGPQGHISRTKTMEIAYNAIHKIYGMRADGLLDLPTVGGGTHRPPADESWRTRAVVVGPTSSGFALRDPHYFWHRDNFEAGMANFLDGLSSHPYNDPFASPWTCDADETRWANFIKSMVDLFNEYYDRRPAVGSGGANAKIHEKSFIWGTEQGMRSEELTGPLVQSQFFLRQTLIVKGEGFETNQSFLYADYKWDGDAIMPYGFFYNNTPMNHNNEVYHPMEISPKKMALAYANMSFLMKGYKSVGRIPGLCNDGIRANGTQWGYKFQDTWNGVNANGPFMYVVWDWEKESDFTLTLAESGKITVYNAIGNDITSEIDITGNTLNLKLTEDVLYIKVE